MKPTTEPISLDQEELRGLARTVAEIEWLLLVLVLLYQAFGQPQDEARIAISMALMFFAAFVLAFRYTNFYRNESRWKIAIEAWAMIAFITWSVCFTGHLKSPLLNCYLLVIITSALTLGKLNTAAFVAVIGMVVALLGRGAAGGLSSAGGLVIGFAPFAIVAYFTSMFSVDIRYGLSKAKMLSETDELTGLLNRRAFAAVAARAFSQAVRYSRPVSALIIDADGLKQVNDKYGHGAGDEMLREVAKCIQHELRTTDILARHGGDEFVVLLPETNTLRTREVAERVRKAVDNARVLIRAETIKTSVSIGIANFPADGRVLEILLVNADTALYRAKAAGRNTVAEYASGADTE